MARRVGLPPVIQLCHFKHPLNTLNRFSVQPITYQLIFHLQVLRRWGSGEAICGDDHWQ